MTDLRKAAQQALEALMKSHTHPLLPDDCEAAITALRAALAEPECKCTMRQKMVGDGCAVCNPERAKDLTEPQTTHWEGCEAVHPECRKPEQEPVAWGYELATTVGKHGYEGWSRRVTHAKPNVPKGSIRNLTPLYTAPAPRKPLTDEEIVRLMVGEDRVQLLYAKPDDPYFSEFAEGAIRELVESGRAIERAHGIGEQT